MWRVTLRRLLFYLTYRELQFATRSIFRMHALVFDACTAGAAEVIAAEELFRR